MSCACETPKHCVCETPKHSGLYSTKECPVIGCSEGRTTRAKITFASGQKKVVTACERHLSLLVARAVMRVVVTRGRDAVMEHIDGYVEDKESKEWKDGYDDAQRYAEADIFHMTGQSRCCR